MLSIKNLTVSVDNKIILNDFNLSINKNEIHALMGLNGSGKSTICKVLMGDPNYKIEVTNPDTGEVVKTLSHDWKKLKDINKEIVAWLKIADTKIDYPVLYHKGDTEKSQFYLYKDMYKDYSIHGSIFVDFRSEKGANSKNVILHNIKEGFIPLLSNNINMIKKGNQKWYVIVMN